MPSTPDPLARVKRAADAERRAAATSRAALLDAVRDALAAGVSYGELGRTLGVSRQAVRQLVERSR